MLASAYILTLIWSCDGQRCKEQPSQRFPQAYETMQQCIDAGEMWQTFRGRRPVLTFSCEIQGK